VPDETYNEHDMPRYENARSLDVTRWPARASLGVGGNIGLTPAGGLQPSMRPDGTRMAGPRFRTRRFQKRKRG
jgi:hypothetical protein